MTRQFPSDMKDAFERARRSLDGLSVGDAFGQRYFVDDAKKAIEQRVLPSAPWRWTDDTAMALSIVEQLEARGLIDPPQLAERFAARYKEQPGRGYGAGAHRILGQIARGESWVAASTGAFDGSGSFGNGGAMRAAPIGAYFADEPASRVATEATRSALPTHAHLEGQAGAIAIALASWAVANDAEIFESVLTHVPSGRVRDGIDQAATFEGSVTDAAKALGTGWRVTAADTVPFCLWCATRHLDDYVEAMWTTVSGLGDADTTCAIVGGIVAVRAPVPADWVAAREPLA